MWKFTFQFPYISADFSDIFADFRKSISADGNSSQTERFLNVNATSYKAIYTGGLTNRQTILYMGLALKKKKNCKIVKKLFKQQNSAILYISRYYLGVCS